MTPDRFKSKPRVFESKEEAKTFFETFNRRYWSPHRDWLACRLMYEAGLRVSEVTALQEAHYKATPSGGEVTVRDGKGGVDRTVGIGRDLRRELDEWIQRRDEKAPEASYLLPTQNGNQLSRQHLHRSVKRAAKRANLREAEEFYPHCLRHSFATNWLRDGGDLENLRRAMGHASLNTTQKYLQLVDDSHVQWMQEVANGGSKEVPTDEDPDGLEAEIAELRAKLEKLEAKAGQ